MNTLGLTTSAIPERPYGRDAIELLLNVLLGKDSLPVLCSCVLTRYALLPSACYIALLEGAVRAGRMQKHQVRDHLQDAPAELADLFVYTRARRAVDTKLRGEIRSVVERTEAAVALRRSLSREAVRVAFDEVKGRLPPDVATYGFGSYARAVLIVEHFGGVEEAASFAGARQVQITPAEDYTSGYEMLSEGLRNALARATHVPDGETMEALAWAATAAARGMIEGFFSDLALETLDSTLATLEEFAVERDRSEKVFGMTRLGRVVTELRQLQELAEVSLASAPKRVMQPSLAASFA